MMRSEDANLLCENPEWRLVLQAYLEAEANSRAAAPVGRNAPPVATAPPLDVQLSAESVADDSADDEKSSVGWSPRLTAVAGVVSEMLSVIHGGLIASGLLKFELFGRDGGLRYRATPQAKAALRQLEESTSSDSDDTAVTSPCEPVEATTPEEAAPQSKPRQRQLRRAA